MSLPTNGDNSLRPLVLELSQSIESPLRPQECNRSANHPVEEAALETFSNALVKAKAIYRLVLIRLDIYRSRASV
jgi:hypothetical protein